MKITRTCPDSFQAEPTEGMPESNAIQTCVIISHINTLMTFSGVFRF